MKQIFHKILIFLFIFLIQIFSAEADDNYISILTNKNGFMLNNKYTILRGGTIQWFRIPEEEWEDRLKRFKASGFNTIDMYVGWNMHEPEEGVFNFDKPDIRKFLNLAKNYGLFIYFRPGPYICNEYDSGGFPAWIARNSTKKDKNADGKPNLRTDDPDYLFLVKRYLNKLNDVIKPFLITNGGPIILYAIENEYNWFETFFNIDKSFELGGDSILSWYDMERGTLQNTGTTAYMNFLQQCLVDDSIDIPITTCPGDSKVSGMGDNNNGWVSNVIPIPNFYIQANVEKLSRELLTSMHDSNNYNGNYNNYPSGTTETFRSASRMKQMIMAGLDAFFAFNIVGMNQEGYLNTVVLDPAATSNILNLFESNWTNANNLFVAPGYGYFHGVVDYYGAISASGTHREKYYHFRRSNLFLSDFEEKIGKVLYASKTGNFDDADLRVKIDSPNSGCIEDGKRVNYFLDSGDSFFISISNQTGNEFNITKEKIQVNELIFPKYSDIVVPIEFVPVNTNDFGPNINDINTCDQDYTMILVTNLEIFSDLKMNYSTSEILRFTDFNEQKLLILYGKEGSSGEIELSGNFINPQINQDNFQIHDSESNNKLAFSYDYKPFNTLLIKTESGNTLRLIITTIKEAGRFWFFKNKEKDYLISSFDYLETEFIDEKIKLVYEARKNISDIALVSPSRINLVGLTIKKSYDPSSNTTIFNAPQWREPPQINDLLKNGKSFQDNLEISSDFDDSSWISWEGEPDFLENKGIYKGHAWYRTTFDLSDVPDDSKLYIKSASDFIGIYVNGKYITTVCPIGTEIDNYSQNAYYRFDNLKSYLSTGKNTIAFRTEIWGHGSFMFPRGKLLYTSIRLPALGFDSMKGLAGEAKAANKKLEQWKLRAKLGGMIKGYDQPEYNDSNWSNTTVPFLLNSGEIRWYRTSFKTSDIIDNKNFYAPVVLELTGENTKATIFLNGRLIGRWLSKGKYPKDELIPEDEEWLRKGTWGRPARDLWNCTDPNHFPISAGLLKKDNEDNILSIVFEDTSPDNRLQGKVDSLKIIYNQEEKKSLESSTINVENIRNKGEITIQPYSNSLTNKIGLDDVIRLLKYISEE